MGRTTNLLSDNQLQVANAMTAANSNVRLSQRKQQK